MGLSGPLFWSKLVQNWSKTVQNGLTLYGSKSEPHFLREKVPWAYNALRISSDFEKWLHTSEIFTSEESFKESISKFSLIFLF